MPYILERRRHQQEIEHQRITGRIDLRDATNFHSSAIEMHRGSNAKTEGLDSSVHTLLVLRPDQQVDVHRRAGKPMNAMARPSQTAYSMP